MDGLLLRFTVPWLLLLLPLATWPWLPRAHSHASHPWLQLLPADPAGEWLHRAVRTLASLTIVALVLAIAQPYRAEYPVERIGRGAEIALVLDRSRSMDQAFAYVPQPGQVQNLLDLSISRSAADEKERPSKGLAARRILSGFVAERREDRFSTQFFSTLPIPVHDFTSKQEVVQAAIAAGSVGRGLADTDIGQAVLRALESFADRTYRGSRIILLVSDGGDYIDPETRARIGNSMRDLRVSIYWIYIRSPYAPKLDESANREIYPDDPIREAYMRPEAFLHRFFASIGVPYRSYQADDPKSLAGAIADVGRLENLPIAWVDTVPRRELAGVSYATALAGLLLLLGARALELKSWA
jgi:mxaC protein